MKRPIGSAESATVRQLYLSGGTWSRTDPPLWENQHWTLRLLDSLVGKGYVDERENVYELSAEGVDLAVTLPVPSPGLNSSASEEFLAALTAPVVRPRGQAGRPPRRPNR